MMLNITRGKPSKEQLNLSNLLLDNLKANDLLIKDLDLRNYGGLGGIPQAKELFSQYLGVQETEIFVGGNSSLSLMYDVIAFAILYGISGEKPWQQNLNKIKFVCPTPGYDRHYDICESLGIGMIPVPLKKGDLDIEQIETIVSTDESIKGMWAVPRYSNPTGICYSRETVKRLAKMHSKAKDFRIFWDDAYAVHHHGKGVQCLLNILRACEEYGNIDRPYLFGSTSKLTFPGGGVAFLGGSYKNIQQLTSVFAKKTIGYDKINQIRQVKFFINMKGILNHADKHAQILNRKFSIVDRILKENTNKDYISWDLPDGGYFIVLKVRSGNAKSIINLSKKEGVTLTESGACFPYKNDPNDEIIRIAPTYLSDYDLERAMLVVSNCINNAN